nr:connectin-like [Rhipicephalus microplus]
MAYDTDSLRRLVGSGSRGWSGGARSATPGSGKNVTGSRRQPRLLHFGSRLPRANVSACFLFLCLVGAVSSLENGTSPSVVPNLCNLAQEEPMYCRCSSEHFEADTTGVVCYVGKPLTGSHAVFQALRRQGALASVTFTVYGEDYRLDFVPSDALRRLSRLEKLRFTDCNLGVLPTKAFYKLSALTLLQLEGNDIIDLQPDAIAHLPRLEKLELGENRLRNVKAGWFSRLPSLTVLFLGKNQIEYVEDLAFAELGALRELELGDNFIHVVTNRTFKGLAQLTRLDLYRNKLMRLDAGIFVSTPLLEELDLKLNQISVIDPLAFDGLARLRLIYLANNQLRILPADMFVGAPNLDLVDLEQNQLVTLTWRTIHNLKYLKDGADFTMSLTGNQMACDCRLAWILQIENATQSEKFRRELRHVSCVFSDPARGKSKVTRLSMEDLGCTGQEEPLPTTPSYTIWPSYSPEEKPTSHASEDTTKRPMVTEKKEGSSAEPKSKTTKDDPVSSAPGLLPALFTVIISAVLCCGRTYST